MFFPIRTDVPLRRTPWMNWLLILLNVLVFIVQAKRGSSFTRRYELDPHNLHLLNYFTYQFLHGGWFHLASNLLFLYIFGNNVNDRMGHLGYLAFYLAGGVVAGAAHVWMESAPVIGASGAVFAVTGAFLILFPRARVTIIYFFMLIGVIELASIWFILAFFVLNVVSQASAMMGGSSGVAYTAHIGGSIFGAGVCLFLLAVRLLPRDQFDVLALLDRWNRRRQFRDMVASGYDPFRYVPPTRGKVNPVLEAQREHVQELRAGIAESMSHSNLPEAVKGYMELRAIDPAQVLSRQNQLDLANHLFEQQHHAAAADAYEGFVRTYPKADQMGHVQLMLGLIFARYLARPDKALVYLTAAQQKLTNERELELANQELARLPRT